MLWDLASNYFGSDLPKINTAQISYFDAHAVQHISNAVLDWETFRGMLNVTVKGAHQAADALEKISKTVGDFSEGFTEKGVRMYVRDGDAKDRDEEVRMRAVVEEMRAAQQAAAGYIEPLPDADPS